MYDRLELLWKLVEELVKVWLWFTKKIIEEDLHHVIIKHFCSFQHLISQSVKLQCILYNIIINSNPWTNINLKPISLNFKKSMIKWFACRQARHKPLIQLDCKKSSHCRLMQFFPFRIPRGVHLLWGSPRWLMSLVLIELALAIQIHKHSNWWCVNGACCFTEAKRECEKS